MQGYLAAIEKSDAEALRSFLAYQPDGDPDSLVTGARIPLECARLEEQGLAHLHPVAGAPVRWARVSPPSSVTGGGSASATLDLAYFPLHNGGEEGREVIEVGRSWYVLAEENDACNKLFD